MALNQLDPFLFTVYPIVSDTVYSMDTFAGAMNLVRRLILRLHNCV